MLQTELAPSQVPLALLPVRLETRFFPVSGGTELRIRVYPDKIHLDSHETLLTVAERTWGVHFWEQFWRAGGGADAQARAWRQLAERYGAARAAWIARQLRPTNAADAPKAPVAAGKPLQPPPTFADPPTAAPGDDAAWRRAPLARLLPERWFAVAYQNNQIALTASGREIVLPLPAGPDPSADVPPPADDQLAIDEGMRWMVDFDTAEARGMALRMPLTPAQAAAGLQRLVVLGVRGTLPPADGAAQFAALLDAHHYTDGLEFLGFGAPTNNTADLRSAYRSSDAAEAASLASELGAAAAALPGSNARALGSALGLAPTDVPDVLGRVPGAGDSAALDSAAMNTALWPVTWGYYLSNLIGFDGTGLTVERLAAARRHFVDHVRGGGPLAAIRCGRQPYGLLPVTSLEQWQPTPGANHAQLQWLRTPLLRLRDNIWRGALAEAPRLGEPADPHEALARVMRTEALSSRYETRVVLGRHYVQHLRAFIGENLAANGWIGTQDAAAAGILQRMNFPWRPRLARGAYGDLSHRLRAPLVQAGEVSAARLPEPNYIAALLAEPSIAAIEDQHAQGAEGGTLLHALLRHALLLEYAGAAAAIVATTGIPLAELLRDVELVDLVGQVGGAAPTLTWRRQLDQTVAAVTGTRTVREHLQSEAGLQASPALRELRAALARLQGQGSEALQYLMQTTLDLASHRLDAWVTSYASERLAAMRAAEPTGLIVGGYGWVENLRPRGFGTLVGGLPDEPGPLYAAPDDTGFIHAPSMMQAATAALLRNAHLGVDGVADANAPLSIDLSSRRLRTARWLLDGVRRGQPLGALLGYRFERRLHNEGLDVEIARFRAIAPLVADKLTASALPAESIAAANVVDGLRLAQWWAEHRASSGTGFGARLVAALDDVGATIDAVADALTAEAAHQAVAGNVSRAASTLSALTRGDGGVPELDVSRTPRTGTAVTHRVLLLFAGAPPATPGWPAPATSPRARTEPILNAWAARVLGDARKLRCLVEVLDAAGAVQQTLAFALSELQIAPLDVVYGVDASARTAQASVLEQRLLHHARQQLGMDGARLRIRSERPAGAAATDLFLADVLSQARALRKLFAGARPLDAIDLDLPERAAAGTIDTARLGSRVSKLETALAQWHGAAAAELAKAEAASAPQLRTLALQGDGFGLAGAIPASAHGDDSATRAVLSRQLALLIDQAQTRLANAAALAAHRPQPADALDSTQAFRRHLAQRFANVFGTDFIALPSFTCGHAAELGAALADSWAVQGGDALACATWFERCKRVRDPLARFATVLTGAEVLGTDERAALRVAQLPHQPGARWAALPATAAAPLRPGCVSLVVQAATNLTPALLGSATQLWGLLVDEWVELVPNAHETTAVTFQSDPPNACAPQAVLLAVPPVPGQPWTGEGLARLLSETLEWARLRAVDAEALGELGHYLPALHLGFNLAGDAVSTDFRPLT